MPKEASASRAKSSSLASTKSRDRQALGLRANGAVRRFSINHRSDVLERAADALAARALGGSDRERKTFLAMPEADKLKTAAYYEVVARRAKGTVKSFAGQTFTPAGTGTRPALSGRQEALRDASNEIKDARRLSATYGAVPKREADVPALENKATAAERTAAAANVAAEKALIIKLVVRDRIGSITGSLDRDLRVIARMAQGRRRSDYFQKRTPASFT
jgi:hypothetical protein